MFKRIKQAWGRFIDALNRASLALETLAETIEATEAPDATPVETNGEHTGRRAKAGAR